MSNNKRYKITIGADPEFIVADKKTHQAVVACHKFGGEKRAPMFLSPDGGFLEDGVTVEFNVTPSSSLKDTLKKLLNLQLVFLNKFQEYEFLPNSSAVYPQEELSKYSEAMNIGCSPDMFAYGLRLAPSISKFQNMRFAGGHVHVGINPWPEGLEKINLVKFIDLLFVLPWSRYYADKSRWKFYGHPGLYRETEYGIEHRSPDNSWCNAARISKLSPDAKEYHKGIISSFDWTMDRLATCFDYDQHGARVNDAIKMFLKTSNIDQVASEITALAGPESFYNYRNHYSVCTDALARWVSERKQLSANRAAIKAGNLSLGK